MGIKNIKLVLLLTVLYVSFPSLSWTEESCRSVFNEITEKLKKVDINQYKGKEGYVRFVEELEGTENMGYVFDEVSEILGSAKMKELQWQKFQGTSEGFKYFKELLSLDVIEKHKGMKGYASFAEKYFEGDMQKAYKNVSAVLGGVLEMRKLNIGWKNFQGTVDQFKDLKKLFESNKREELKGEKGQSRVAREIFKGNKRKAYDMVSALREYLLGRAEAFDELDWRK